MRRHDRVSGTRTAACALLLAAAYAVVAPPAAAANEPTTDARALSAALAAYDRFEPHTLLGWHPRRRELLASSGPADRSQVSAVREPGAAPQRLTDLGGGTHDAGYAPGDGRYFVFIGAEDAHGTPRLYRKDVATGALDALSARDEAATAFAWSPVGERLVYATRGGANAEATRLHLVDPAQPASDRVLARFERGTWSDFRFSPDGRRVVFRERVSDADRRLWVMDVGTGKRRRVTRVDRRGPVSYGPAAFSRDGREILTTSARAAGPRRLVAISVGGGHAKVLVPKIAHDIERFAVSLEAGRIAFTTDEDGVDVLRFLDLDTLRELPRPPLVAGVITALRWRPQSQEIGFAMSGARSAGDVFSYDLASNKLARWTNGNSPDVNTAAFAEPRAIAWKGDDGHRLTGFLYAPPARFAGPRPVLVRVHAPGHEARPGFIGRDNYLVSELGIAIVHPSPRCARAGANRGDDLADLAALLEWIAAQPGLDGARIAIADDDDGGLPALAVASRLGNRPLRRVVLDATGTETNGGGARSAGVWLLVRPDASIHAYDAPAFTATVGFARRTLLAAPGAER